MDALVENALTALERLGWRVKRAAQRRKLPAAIAKRYPDIPPLALEFVEGVETCVRGDDAVWFLAAADFAGTATDSARTWDEFERMALEETDEDYAKEARVFWDGHLPVLLSVEGDFLFLAIDIAKGSKTSGAVIGGEALGFEDASVWTKNFEQLLKDIVACSDNPAFDGYVGLHVLTPEQHGERQAARKGKSLIGKLFGR